MGVDQEEAYDEEEAEVLEELRNPDVRERKGFWDIITVEEKSFEGNNVKALKDFQKALLEDELEYWDNDPPPQVKRRIDAQLEALENN